MDRDIIIELTKWIESNISSPIKVKDVASRSGYSTWYLQRVFFNELNVTIAQYIRERKMELAASDLISSSEPILIIALKYGYDNHPAFTRVFKKHFKTSPSKWRVVNSYPTHQPL